MTTQERVLQRRKAAEAHGRVLYFPEFPYFPRGENLVGSHIQCQSKKSSSLSQNRQVSRACNAELSMWTTWTDPPVPNNCLSSFPFREGLPPKQLGVEYTHARTHRRNPSFSFLFLWARARWGWGQLTTFVRPNQSSNLSGKSLWIDHRSLWDSRFCTEGVDTFIELLAVISKLYQSYSRHLSGRHTERRRWNEGAYEHCHHSKQYV